jgi:hypothetical protein
MTEQQWRNQWDATRMFFTADGESGKPGGNETIRIVTDDRLRIKTPAALAEQFGSHVGIEAPIQFSHCGDEWAARVNARRAVRYDISYDPARDRWYLDASWHTDPNRDSTWLTCAPGRCWVWTSTTGTSRSVCSTLRATRTESRAQSRW